MLLGTTRLRAVALRRASVAISIIQLQKTFLAEKRDCLSAVSPSMNSGFRVESRNAMPNCSRPNGFAPLSSGLAMT
jgi:hypothetical protein